MTTFNTLDANDNNLILGAVYTIAKKEGEWRLVGQDFGWKVNGPFFIFMNLMCETIFTVIHHEFVGILVSKSESQGKIDLQINGKTK